MPAPTQNHSSVDIGFLAAKRLEYEKIALTQQAVLDVVHNNACTTANPSATSSTALSASNIADPYAFLRGCDKQLACVYEDGTEPSLSERHNLLHVAERALAVWHEYIMARESLNTQIAVTRQYLELAREWSKTIGSSANLAGSELRRYPLHRPRTPARPLTPRDISVLQTDPRMLCAKAFLLYPGDASRSGVWRVIGIEHEETEIRQGRTARRDVGSANAEVVYEVLFEECEQTVNVQSSVIWSLIRDSWYFDESA
ncbi:hypothetical protein PENSPDRAFT_737008 [Peniophora sp. CONT]|nr:hypothetical protein PENSPDRAFT_737008 [Peniophora sp. CONT]